MIEEVKIEDYPKWRDENPNANEVWVDHGNFGKTHRTFNYKSPNDVTLCERLGMYDGFGRFHFIDEEGTRHICYKPDFTFFKKYKL